MKALISVYNKDGVVDLAKNLLEAGAGLLSTGGTYRALSESGVTVRQISDFTGHPEILDGRVKSLHPKIHGGILARRDSADHVAELNRYKMEPIDIVVVNLYPFEETIAKSDVTQDDAIENIDIGGPTLIRAAAKNHAFVVVLVDPCDYPWVSDKLLRGGLSYADRRYLAAKAFQHVAVYDTIISQWLDGPEEKFNQEITLAFRKVLDLRYGENPHQNAAFYITGAAQPGVGTANQIQGKSLSYNNLNDTDAAFELVAEFDRPAVAIIKHANPCGVALGATSVEAYQSALACDPVSAFGGIIAFNRRVDEATAKAVVEVFSEVVIAPDADEPAKNIFSKKKNLRLLLTGSMPQPNQQTLTVRSLAGGLLVQDRDQVRVDSSMLKVVTERAPNASEVSDLIFAFQVCKHVKSNAIVFAKNGASLGIGAGQMSRVDSSRIAAFSAATTTGKCSGRQPAITALTASFSRVTLEFPGCMRPSDSDGLPP